MIALRNKRPVFTLVAGLVMSLGAPAQNVPSQQRDSQSPQSDWQSEQQETQGLEGLPSESGPIEGTWIFTIDRFIQGVSFTALQSFTAGGVTLATGTLDRTPPPPISPLYGSWKRSGRNHYVATICFFAFNDAGTAVAMIKTHLDLRLLGRDRLQGSGSAVACEPNGDNCVDANLPITIRGRRLIPEGPSQ